MPDKAKQIEAEQILIDHGIGKCIQPRDPGWDKKKSLYTREKVWGKYVQLRSKYSEKFTDPVTTWVDRAMANKVAQVELDNQLFAQVRGQVPTEAELSDPVDEQLISRERFGKNLDADLDHMKDIEYVWNNIGFKDNKPEDAPSTGAFFYLQRLQENTDASNDFYKQVWTKTIPSKSVIEDSRKRHDDGRSITGLIERLQGESKGDTAVG